MYSSKFTVVLDACVLYPAPRRDILLSLAAEGLFKPKWTNLIQEEWVRNLLKKTERWYQRRLFLCIKNYDIRLHQGKHRQTNS